MCAQEFKINNSKFIEDEFIIISQYFKNIHIEYFKAKNSFLLTICLIWTYCKDKTMADQIFMFATMAGTMGA